MKNEPSTTRTHPPKIDPVVADRRRVLSLVFLFALAVRVLNLILLSRHAFFEFKIGDSARYDQWAHRIADGNWIGNEVFYQAPLYPYFLATIYATVGDNIFVTRLIQAAIGALACAFLAAAAWNFFNRRAAIIAGAMIACYVPSIFLETLLQKSVLDLFFVCLILWLYSRILIQQKTRLWLMLGAAIGLLCLTRENALALVPVFGLASLLVVSGKRLLDPSEDLRKKTGFSKKLLQNAAQQMPLYAAGLAIVLLPVALRNYSIGGEFHITTSQLGPNFYIGNNPQATGFYRPLVFGRGDAKFEQADAIALAESAEGRELTAGEVSDYYLGQSWSYISSDPVDWARLLGKKTLLSLNRKEVVDTEDQYVFEQYSPVMWLLSPIFNFGLALTLGLLGIWYARHRWREFWPIVLMLAVFQLTMIAFFVFGRYRFPVVPILVCFAGSFTADIYSVFKAGITKSQFAKEPESLRRNYLFTVLAFVLLCAVAFQNKIPIQGQASVTYNNWAIQSLIRSDFDQAHEYLDKSLEHDPEFAIAINSKGVWHRERGELEMARECFGKAVLLAPEYENARINLAKLTKKPQPD